MQLVKLSTVKKGEAFRRTENAKTTYLRGDYVRCRGVKPTYECHDDMDYNRCIYLKGQSSVYVGFTY